MDDIYATFHDIDVVYLKRIFRSDTIHTIQSFHATSASIQRALRQIVPSLCFDKDHERDWIGKRIEYVTVVVLSLSVGVIPVDTWVVVVVVVMVVVVVVDPGHPPPNGSPIHHHERP